MWFCVDNIFNTSSGDNFFILKAYDVYNSKRIKKSKNCCTLFYVGIC